uniref:Uncharacterized protein n=1 Tax=Arundo donax TaxID=35708 RepID=A0A0A9GU90_ARUDO
MTHPYTTYKISTTFYSGNINYSRPMKNP